jgi:NAD(P)H-dependent FMN reductase
MKTVIINGSPNGRRGNTEILSREFIKGMKTPAEIRYAAEEDASTLAAYMQGFDNWLFFFPLYVNAMPGIVKRLFEKLRHDETKAVGYFVQSGFEEAAQSDYLVALLKNYNRRMGYRDLGIVVAGGMAGVRYMPERMNRKTFENMRSAGALYEQTGRFSDESVQYFGRLRQYTKAQAKRNEFLRKIGLMNVFWNGMLKKNKAYHSRLDKPFGV